jgi:hypothetical protein
MAVKKRKATTKKVAGRKIVKKRVKKKSATKKVVVRKVVKKSVKKKAPAKKMPTRIKPARATLDSHSLFLEVPISKSFKSINDAIEQTSLGIPITESTSPSAPTPARKSGKTKYVAIVALLLVLGFGGFMFANNPSSPAEVQSEVVAEPEVVAPIANPITTSFTYTSTGIRLTWSVKGIDVESILISSAEDGKDFAEIKTLASTARFLNLMKTDTTGSTKFQVTTTTTKGETFSSTVGLRGSFKI